MSEFNAIIGIIDAYGAIHYKKLTKGVCPFHETHWPTETHKRWRFDVRDWDLSKSILNRGDITEAEEQDILAKMRKVCKVPEWVLRGEAWEKAGRPRGEDYDL